MVTAELLRARNDIEFQWPARQLLEAVGFETKVRTRVLNLLKTRGMETLSLRGLMDLILPLTAGAPKSAEAIWGFPPIMKQPQFGPILYNSALLTLTEADLGPAFRAEWALRVYHRLMLSGQWLTQVGLSPLPQRQKTGRRRPRQQ